MIPNPKAFHNQFKVVKLPSVKALFLRSGFVEPQSQSVDPDEYGGVLSRRKNDLAEEIERLADQVPVHEPEEPKGE